MLFLGEIIHGIIITNVFNNFSDGGNICGILALFDNRTELRAKNTAEILVASIREEASGVGQHSYEF